MSIPGNQKMDDVNEKELDDEEILPNNEELSLDDSAEEDKKESKIPIDIKTDSTKSNVKHFHAGTISEGDLDATRLYLSEIGFSPLLTAEEEVFLRS